MELKLVSAEEFQKAPVAGVGVVKAFTAEIKQIGDADSRQFEFRITTGDPDRDDDTINPKGWVTDSFQANPIVLFGHDYKSLPIGRAVSLTQDEKGLRSVVEFTPPGMNAFADTVHDMVKAGFLKATSVGFKPIEYKQSKDEKRPYGIDFQKQELLEFSIVPVPSNPHALIGAAAAGIDTKLITGWAMKLLGDNLDNDIRTKLLELAKPAEDKGAGVDLNQLEPIKKAADDSPKPVDETPRDPAIAALIKQVSELAGVVSVLATKAAEPPKVEVKETPKAQDDEPTDDELEVITRAAMELFELEAMGKLPANF